MANINKEIENPCFRKEFGEYLEANGFQKSNNQLFSKTFVKDDKAVVITADRASFRILDLGEDGQRDPEFSEQYLFEGISTIDINKWIMLLHITNSVSIKTFASNVRRMNMQPLNMVHMAEDFFSKTKTAFILLLIASTLLFTSASANSQVYAGVYLGYSHSSYHALNYNTRKEQRFTTSYLYFSMPVGYKFKSWLIETGGSYDGNVYANLLIGRNFQLGENVSVDVLAGTADNLQVSTNKLKVVQTFQPNVTARLRWKVVSLEACYTNHTYLIGIGIIGRIDN